MDGPLSLSPAQVDHVAESLISRLQQTAPSPLAGAMTVLSGLATAALAVVILFLLLKNGPRLGRSLVELFPPAYRSRAHAAARTGWSTLIDYMRGVVTVAAVEAVAIGIALLVLDVPLVLALAVLTFLGAFIPIVGALLAGAATVLVAFVSSGPVTALIVLGVILVVQQLEGNVLYPLIMGNSLRLNALSVLLAVSAGTLLAGLVGAVVAVPLVAVVYRAWIAVHDAGEAANSS